MSDTKNHSHYHKDEQGMLVRCYHKCKTSLSDVSFWIGLTIGFPIEHFLYEKVFPFTLIKDWLGL